MSARRIRIGTRGSALALWQANWVIQRLAEAAPGVACEITIIKTEGDRRQDIPLAAVGGQGVFVAELEAALAEDRVDVAVHSAKDLPTTLHPDLLLAAFLVREDVHDVLISTRHKSLKDLPEDARIGTGSFRRISQLSNLHPRWRFEDLRGNLDTRLAKLDSQELDAIVLAAAGLIRLGWKERITERLSIATCLPAVGQGAVTVEARRADQEVRDLLAKLDHMPTRQSVLAERAMLRALQGGCQAPIGANGRLMGDMILLEGMVAAADGSVVIRRAMEGPMDKPEELGDRLAAELELLGAKDLLAASR